MRRKLQKVANGFADWRAAGFTRDQMWHAGTLQSRGQSLHLRRLSATLGSLKRDEWHPAHHADCETKQRNCRTRALEASQFAARNIAGLSSRMKSFWLVKQEPSSYSWSDFVAEGQTSWTGVRNYAARNNLRRMQKDDQVLFYHSGEDKAVVGIAKVMRTAYPDSTANEGDWSTVDLAPVKPLRRPVTLREIKSNRRLKAIPLVRQSRLSVMPLPESAFREILNMATHVKSLNR